MTAGPPGRFTATGQPCFVALVVGYAAVLAVTWWSVVPRERALALPLGVLAVVASVLRAR